MRTLTHAIGTLAVAVLLGLAGDVTPARAQGAPLTLVFTPSRDPTALKGAGDAFAKTLAEISGVPVRALVARTTRA